MEGIPIDPKRTVDATPDAPDYEEEYGPPGSMSITRTKGVVDGMLLCCPGCGRRSWMRCAETVKPSQSPSWLIAEGSAEDVRTLSLAPSVNCQGCCGWHGYLIKGTWRPC